MLVGVSLNQAGVDRKALTADKTGCNTGPDDPLEYEPEDPVIAETLIARPREHRVIRNVVLDAKPAEPAVSKVNPHLAAERSLRTDRKHIADNQHPYHQHRINRWSTKRRIVRRQLRPNPRQIKNLGNRAHQMIARHDLFEIERIKKL